MKRIWIRNLLGGLSLSTALFLFQACYGTPQDLRVDILIEGLVKSKTTGSPVPGIKISIDNVSQYQYSDAEGKFSLYTEKLDNYNVHFEDIDSTENGSFFNKDTVLMNVNNNVYLNIELEEK
jgi:hypothetical protein